MKRIPGNPFLPAWSCRGGSSKFQNPIRIPGKLEAGRRYATLRISSNEIGPDDSLACRKDARKSWQQWLSRTPHWRSRSAEPSMRDNCSNRPSRNISMLLGDATSPFYEQAVAELAAGGRMGRTERSFLPDAGFRDGRPARTDHRKNRDQGGAGRRRAQIERPQFPCVGTNAMNFFNVSRATQGLVAYLHEWRARQKIDLPGKHRRS